MTAYCVIQDIKAYRKSLEKFSRKIREFTREKVIKILSQISLEFERLYREPNEYILHEHPNA